MIFLLILLGIITYLTIGAISARVLRPAIISASTEPKGTKYLVRKNGFSSAEFIEKYGTFEYRKHDYIDRTEAFYKSLEIIFAWPVTIPLQSLSHSLDRAIDKVDPEVYIRSQKRIKELERELEMR